MNSTRGIQPFQSGSEKMNATKPRSVSLNKNGPSMKRKGEDGKQKPKRLRGADCARKDPVKEKHGTRESTAPLPGLGSYKIPKLSKKPVSEAPVEEYEPVALEEIPEVVYTPSRIQASVPEYQTGDDTSDTARPAVRYTSSAGGSDPRTHHQSYSRGSRYPPGGENGGSALIPPAVVRDLPQCPQEIVPSYSTEDFLADQSRCEGPPDHLPYGLVQMSVAGGVGRVEAGPQMRHYYPMMQPRPAFHRGWTDRGYNGPPRTLCKFFEAGHCRFGPGCKFLHPGQNNPLRR